VRERRGEERRYRGRGRERQIDRGQERKREEGDQTFNFA
jgi:hypothetical protein